jgi:hypothetical protein
LEETMPLGRTRRQGQTVVNRKRKVCTRPLSWVRIHARV